MPVELRKRKAPEAAPTPAPPAKKKSAVSKVAEKVKEALTPMKSNGVAAPTTSAKATVGSVISLDTFGGEIETNDGQKTTLKLLVEASKNGVVLFTYPKASTPGCTKQACLFRDSYAPLTATGFDIFGLSADSPKSNTTFKEKQKLPYALLCDPKQTLISAIGMKKPPKSTARGVFVVDKSGKVLAAEPGGPDATVQVVKRLVETEGAKPVVAEPVKEAPIAETLVAETPVAESLVSAKPAVAAPAVKEANVAESTVATAAATNGEDSKEDTEKADVAADVTDTAEKIDSKEEAPASTVA